MVGVGEVLILDLMWKRWWLWVVVKVVAVGGGASGEDGLLS